MRGSIAIARLVQGLLAGAVLLAFGVDCTATDVPASPNPWLAVDRHRGAIIAGLVSRFASGAPEQAQAQLRDALGRLRADALFSASLAGSYDDVVAIVVEAGALNDPARRVGVQKLGSSRPDLAYTPIVPCRIVDTRFGAGGALAGGATRNWLATNPGGTFAAQGGSATNCGIAVKAAAVMANITVFNTAPGPAFIAAWPFGQPQPGTATLNWTSPGSQVANGALLPLCTGGGCSADFSVFAAAATDLVIDVVGYFSAPSGGYVLSVAPSGAQYASIQAAIDAAALSASATQPYLVKVAPGIYTEQVTLKDFVDVEGSGSDVTQIDFSAGRPTVTAGAFAEMRGFTISNGATGTLASGNGGVAVAASTPSATGNFTRMVDVVIAGYGANENVGIQASVGAIVHVLHSDVMVGNPAATGAQYAVVADAPGSVTVRDSRLTAFSLGTPRTARRVGGTILRISNTRMIGGPTEGTPQCFSVYDSNLQPFTCN